MALGAWARPPHRQAGLIGIKNSKNAHLGELNEQSDESIAVSAGASHTGVPKPRGFEPSSGLLLSESEQEIDDYRASRYC